MDYNNRQNFSSYTILDSKQIPAGAISKKFMSGVFLWMFIALGVSALLAFLFATNEGLTSLLYATTAKGVKLTMLGMLISFAPLIFVFTMSLGINRFSSGMLTLLLLLFAATMGMSLSTLFIVYTSGSLLTCFASASAMFGIMALMGYTTEKDLTKFGSILMMGLVGIVIASMINWFLHSPALYYLISYVGIAVFLGLTAYDVQKLKRIGAGLEFGGASAGDTQKLTIMGALTLYLDFINLFVMLLSIFGKRNDD